MSTTGKDKKNQSQYTEHNPYWNSQLFDEVYLRNDVPIQNKIFWDHTKDFNRFQTDFADFVIEQKKEKFSSWSESDTIKDWIVPIMEMLGWNDKCSKRQTPFIQELALSVTELGQRKSFRFDLAYVDDPAHKKFIKDQDDPEDRLREARSEHTGLKMIVEAKYWDRLQDYKLNKKLDAKRCDIEDDDTTRFLSPDNQILNYLEIAKLDFGILTDGKTWRLYHREVSREGKIKSYEFDLGNLRKLVLGGLDKGNNLEIYLEQAKYFYFFFRKEGFYSKTGMPFVPSILEHSKKYASLMHESLKERFMEAIGLTCNAMAKGNSVSKAEYANLRNTGESHIFNMLFIRSCEANKYLPLHAPAYLRISLTEIIETLDYMSFDPRKGFDTYERYFRLTFGDDFDLDGTELYERLLNLYQVVQKGNAGFGINSFQESVFLNEEFEFAQDHPIDNRSMIEIIFTLFFTKSKYSSRAYQQIPYSIFSPLQIGSIYETFLEFELKKASKSLAFLKNGGEYEWVEVDLDSAVMKEKDCPKVRKGDFFFAEPAGKNDRRSMGTYFTEEYVVDFMVDETISPITDSRTPAEILEIKVCDPAMGSAHFLIGSLRHLAQKYVESSRKHAVSDKEVTIHEAKAEVLRNCIYGIDINQNALKLAKLALWLESAHFGQRLEKLDGKLQCGNALAPSEKWNKEFVKAWTRGFDVVIGNPPFVGKQHRTEAQKNDVNNVFQRKSGSSNLDYVACWYPVTAKKLLNSNGRACFVSSSSIVQGEQVAALWPDLLSEGLNIDLAVRPFLWPSKLNDSASVSVVVVGFSLKESDRKFICEHDAKNEVFTKTAARNISPYLIDFDNTIVKSRSKTLCDVPEMAFGSMPNDGGNFLFSPDEKRDFIRMHPEAKKYFKKFIGSRDHLNGKDKWCLWLQNHDLKDLKKVDGVKDRIENVMNLRKKSTRSATKTLASVPHLFGEIRQPSGNYILIPLTTSENREYIPCTFQLASEITGNTCGVIDTSSMYHLGVVCSKMHMAWMRTVGGRLKSDYRYSVKLVYNNFPWPDSADKEKIEKVENAATKMVEYRTTLLKDKSLSEIYKPGDIDKKLKYLHEAIDKAVDDCYGFVYGSDEKVRIEFLFELYKKILGFSKKRAEPKEAA